jgi:NitT/TauT family transport system substrate-binding protein
MNEVAMSMQYRRSRYTWLTSALLAVVVVFVLAGCGASVADHPNPTAVTRLVVAAVPAEGAAGLYIAQEQGLFRKAGLVVRIESAVSSADVLANLVHGDVNVSLGQWTSALAAEADGIKLRAIAAGNDGASGLEELVSGAGSGIKRPIQLAGKTIGVNALNGLSQLLVEAVLSSDGIQPSRLHWVAIPFPNMAAAVAGHKVDAAFMVQPYALAAERAKTVTELVDIDTGAVTRNFPITGYVTTQAWAKRNPAALAAFSRALAEGQRVAAGDPAAVVQAVAKYTGITASPGMPIGGFPSAVTAAQLTRVAVLMKQYGLLPTANPSKLAMEMLP